MVIVIVLGCESDPSYWNPTLHFTLLNIVHDETLPCFIVLILFYRLNIYNSRVYDSLVADNIKKLYNEFWSYKISLVLNLFAEYPYPCPIMDPYLRVLIVFKPKIWNLDLHPVCDISTRVLIKVKHKQEMLVVRCVMLLVDHTRC